GRVEGHDGRRTGQREVVRVEVFPAVGTTVLDRETVRAELRPLEGVQGRLLARPRFEVLLSHRPSLTTLRAWTDRSKAEAIERLSPLLLARVEGAGQEAPGGRVVRWYKLGPSRCVGAEDWGKR